jgi:microcin C transport system substrate-binding protein
VVNGPYALEEVKVDRSVKLVRRGDWWGRARKYNLNKFNFDHIVFKSIEDQTKALENLRKEEFDSYAIYSSKIWVKDTLDPGFEQVQKNWIVRQSIYNAFPRGFQGFAMNMRRAIFQDVRVRQALACLLNRQAINEKLMYNQYFLLNSYFPDLYPNYTNPDVPVMQFDPDKARALLKDAGWQPGPDGVLMKDGQPFSLKFLYVVGEPMAHLNIYLEDLKSVGIQASVDQVSESTLSERVDHYNFDMVWRSWEAVRLENPESMWSSKQAGEVAGQNICGVKDTEVDSLIEQQKTEFDAGRRKEILKKLDARLVALCPYVLLWNSNDVRLLYWNRFGTPKSVLSKFQDESDALIYWWFDPDKSRALDDARQNGMALPALHADVHYPE